MAVNRYTTVDWAAPTSSYIPKPFEEMMMIGKNMQDSYDKSLKDLEVTDPIAKLNPKTAMKVYDPSSPEGVRDISLDWTGQRDQAINTLNAEKNKFTDEYIASGDIETFKKKSREYINKASQVHSDLSAKQAAAKQISDYNKELAKNKDFSLQGHLGQKLLDYNTQYYKDAAEGNLREYAPYDVAAPTNRIGETKDYFGSMGKEILTSFSDPTNTGYIRTKYREGLSGNKIDKVFNSWYQNSKVQDDIRLEALDKASRMGINTQDKVKIQVPVSRDRKTGKITYKEEEMTWIDAYEEQKLNEVKDIALGFKSSSGKDALSTDSTYWKNKDEENETRALKGQPLESATFKNFVTKNNNDYKDLVGLGVFTEGANGVTLNWDKLAGASNTTTGYTTTYGGPMGGASVNTTGKTIPSDEKGSKMRKLVKEMADAINYQGEFKADNYQDILNQYHNYDKIRMFDEQMSAPVSKIESAKAERNWNNYDVLSTEDPTNPIPDENKPTFSKNAGDQLILNNWRNTIDGKMNRDGYIKRKNGSIEPIVVRPKALIDDGYHNNIADINLNALKYEVGQVKGVPTKDGVTELVSQKIIPGVGIVEVLGYKNTGDNNKKTTMFTLTPTDNQGKPSGKTIGYKTQADLQQALNSKYYNTDAGFSDRQSIASPKQSYESTGFTDNEE